MLQRREKTAATIYNCKFINNRSLTQSTANVQRRFFLHYIDDSCEKIFMKFFFRGQIALELAVAALA
jgi:hypothetical protein